MRRELRWALLVAALLAGGVQGADTKLPPDLLEFLGSLDSEDPEWHDYLAGNDVTRLPKPPAAQKPAAPDQSKDEAKP